MGTQPLKFGLVGAGPWGRVIIKTLSKFDDIELVLLASSNSESAKLVSSRCTISKNWKTVAGADAIDGVIIATPPHTHAEIARFAVASHNPVLVEKPLTPTIEEAKSLLDFLAAQDAIVHINHTHLGHPAYRELKKKTFSDGPIRSITSIAGDHGPFREDVSVLWDRGSHEIALCIDLLGETPKSIKIPRYDILPSENGNFETIDLKLIFSNNITADITLSNHFEAKTRIFSVSLINETLKYDGTGAHALTKETFLYNKNTAEVHHNIIEIPNIFPLDQILSDFALAIRTNDTSLSHLKLGVSVIEVLTKCTALSKEIQNVK